MPTLITAISCKKRDCALISTWGDIVDVIVPRQRGKMVQSLLRCLRDYECSEYSLQEPNPAAVYLSKDWPQVFGTQYIARKEFVKLFLGEKSFNPGGVIHNLFTNTFLFNVILDLSDLRLVLLCAIEKYGQEGAYFVIMSIDSSVFLTSGAPKSYSSRRSNVAQ